jgi:hypothetical protein
MGAGGAQLEMRPAPLSGLFGGAKRLRQLARRL